MTSPIQHDPPKHIGVVHYFVRERVAHGDLILRYIPTSLQLADIFIKGLFSKYFFYNRTY